MLCACVGPNVGGGAPPGKGGVAKPRPAEAPARAAEESTSSDAERILRYYARLLAMRATELGRELDERRQAFESDRSEINRVKLAVLLSMPATAFRDDAAAVSLLNVFVRDKAREGSDLQPLALWLHGHLLELRRSDEALQQQNAKLKEEQRRADALQQKLDAILDMEMKMLEREQNLPKKK